LPVRRSFSKGGSLDTGYFGLPTAALSARNDGQQGFSAAISAIIRVIRGKKSGAIY
jgi:hypothetical protein